MSLTLSPIVHALNAQQPPLYGTFSTDISGFDPLPAGATATFYMRAVNSSTLKVSGGAATIDSEPLNQVHYNWQAADVNAAGFYVGWWRVTLAGGQYAESPEFLIEIRAHAPSSTAQYVTAAQLKQSLGISDSTFADPDVELACEAASRAIDQRTSRTFGQGSPGEARTYYTPSPAFVEVDDVTAITSVTVDGTAITTAQYRTDNSSPGWPTDSLVALNGYMFGTRTHPIIVTGTYGWAAVPPEIKSAARIVAARLLRRTREATFGVIGLGFEGAAVNIARFDPDLDYLLGPYERSGGSLAQG